MIELSKIYPMAVRDLTEQFKQNFKVERPRIPKWDLGEINHLMHKMDPVFSLKYEEIKGLLPEGKDSLYRLSQALFMNLNLKMSDMYDTFIQKLLIELYLNYTKTVIAQLDEDKFKRLMGEYQNSMSSR